MNGVTTDNGSKKVKNLAAIVYLLVLIFLVGGSYLNQQRHATDAQNGSKPLEMQNTGRKAN